MSKEKKCQQNEKNYVKCLLNNSCLEILYSPIPPTENKIRVVRRYGRKKAGIAYTKEAQHYKQDFITFCRNYFTDINKFTKGHKITDVYSLNIILLGPPSFLLNKTWLKGKAKSPYKKLDAGNRRKLIEDALSEILGIDDSMTFELHISKRIIDIKEPKIKLILTREDPSSFGIPKEYYDDKN